MIPKDPTFGLPMLSGQRRQCIQCRKEYSLEKFPPRQCEIPGSSPRAMTCVYCQKNTKKGLMNWGDITRTSIPETRDVEYFRKKFRKEVR